MYQWALTVPTYSPDGESIYASSNSALESESITRTGGGSCSELPSNITCRDMQYYVLLCEIYMYIIKIIINVRMVYIWYKALN